jgi:hypothetical protein
MGMEAKSMTNLNAGWHSGRAENAFDILIPPRPWPDFPALVPILLDLHQPLDTESGETVLTSAEAARIRGCGLAARAGRWRCPLLPDYLVFHVSILWLLSERLGPDSTRGNRWHLKRAAVLPLIPPIDPVSKFERRLILRLQLAPSQRLNRPALKRTYWRRGASAVDFTVNRLVAKDYITERDGWLYPFSRADFRKCQEAERRPRLRVPISTTRATMPWT